MQHKISVHSSDWHAPFHHVQAVETHLQALAKMPAPDIYVLHGDFLDCHALSMHTDSTRADRPVCLKEELGDAISLFKRLNSSLPSRCKKIYIEGNHEDRLARYLRQHKAMYGLVSIESLLNLKKYGWEHVAYGNCTTVGNIVCSHTFNYSGRGTADKNLEEALSSVMTGHSHRLEHICRGTVQGLTLDSIQLGWLGDAEAATQYFPVAKQKRWWAHGFAIAHHTAKHSHACIIRIVDGECVV